MSRTIHLRNGKRISLDVMNAIETDDGIVNYPPGSLHAGDHGIEAVEVEDYPDPELFSFTENEDGTLNISPLPADVLKKKQADKVLQEIANKEAANAITQRNIRDLSIAVAQLIEMVTKSPASANPAYQKIIALEAELAPLRAQYKALTQ